MTIQMLRTWNGLEEDAVYTLASAAEETRLIGLGLARDYRRGMDGEDPVLTPLQKAATQALVSRDWILNGASAGVASAWTQFSPNQRISYALDSGSAATTAAVDYSFDGGATSAGQAYTISYSSSAAFEVGTLLVSPFFVNLVQAARNAGTFTGYFFRVTVLSGGPLSVFNNP